MKPKLIWVLIADAGEAKVYESQGPGFELVPVDDMTFAAEMPASRDILADRPGRSFDSAGPGRHAMEAQSDPHRELKRTSARTLADSLETGLQKKRFDRLILVAPPQMLGDLRDALSKQVQAKVAVELGKDLVRTPERELPHHLHDALRAAGRKP